MVIKHIIDNYNVVKQLSSNTLLSQFYTITSLIFQKFISNRVSNKLSTYVLHKN